MAAQIIRSRRCVKWTFLEKLERLFEPGGDEIIALRRKMADEQFERGARVEAGLKITRRHR